MIEVSENPPPYYFRIMLLDQLTRIPHAPSVPFQTTPTTMQVPDEVGLSTEIECYFPFLFSNDLQAFLSSSFSFKFLK